MINELNKNTPNEDFKEMTFLEHLEELRWTIVKSIIGIIIGAVLSWTFIDFIVNEILLYPAKVNGIKLQNLRPFGQIFLYLQIALFSGLIISLPWVVYQIWLFISPALHRQEKKYVSTIVIFTSLSFLLGAVFAYLIILPYSLNFGFNFGSQAIENKFSIDEYISIVLSMVLVSGIVFELPMLSFFLTKIGLLTPNFLRRYWRHAIVVIFILSAIITPTTDPVSMMLLAIPLFLLYEISIWISKISLGKKN